MHTLSTTLFTGALHIADKYIEEPVGVVHWDAAVATGIGAFIINGIQPTTLILYLLQQLAVQHGSILQNKVLKSYKIVGVASVLRWKLVGKFA